MMTVNKCDFVLLSVSFRISIDRRWKNVTNVFANIFEPFFLMGQCLQDHPPHQCCDVLMHLMLMSECKQIRILTEMGFRGDKII